MKNMQTAFQIVEDDNVATALEDILPGAVVLLGDSLKKEVAAITEVPKGHKIAIKDIEAGGDIRKYGVRIGRAIRDIKTGEWVHLHNICSVYDARSSHLDVMTGAPKDTKYE